jgi:hypothetical protein
MARSAQAQPHFSLDLYRQRFDIPPWAFNGVENPNENRTGCDHYWTQWERNDLAQALDDAEGDLAGELNFYLGARYLTDTDRPWDNPLRLHWGYVLGAGVRARDEVTPSASDFTTDPATITVPAASFSGGTSEVVVLEDSTGLALSIEVATSGANYVISIDQYNLLKWSVLEDQTDTIDYNAAFPAASWLKLADVTVYRQYRDTNTQATITYGPTCCCWCTSGQACAGTDYTGCAFVLDQEIGLVRVNRATLSAGVWSCDTSAVCGCYGGDKVTVHYEAGTDDIPGWERAVWRLAHSQMGEQPCGCKLHERQWRNDRNTPSVLTAERLNCPFGLTEGAWAAWRWADRHAHGKGYML